MLNVSKVFFLLLAFASPAAFGDERSALDHDPEPRDVARVAYRLADSAVGMARDASYYYDRLAYFADRVHMEASDVYHAAKREGGLNLLDHEEMNQEYFEVRDAYNQLVREYQYTRVTDRRVQQDFYNVQRTYRELVYAMTGQNTLQ